MFEYLTLGPTPAGETCERSDGDWQKIHRENLAYLHQLQRQYPDARFGIKSFPHDFGSYREVVVYYSDRDMDLAFEIESNLPENWDSEALEELNNANV